MSGGVDSSVTLALLTDPAITSHLELDISAVIMRNWSPLQNEVDHHSFQMDCEWEKDWEDVKEVCEVRGVEAELVSTPGCRMDVVSEGSHVPLHVSPGFQIDLSNEYWLQVFEPSISAWQSGQTPNPGVSCNRQIKFGALMTRALGSPSPLRSSGRQHGRKFLATGHYARVEWRAGGRTKLLRSADGTKDQTYYLSSVPEAQLSRVSLSSSTLRMPYAVR